MNSFRTLSTGLAALAASALLVLAGATGAAAQEVYPPAPTGGSISSTTPGPDDDMTVTAGGFAAGEPVTATVYSTPVPLGTRPADASGSVSFSWNNAALPVGAHHAELVGANGRVVSLAFTIVGDAQAGAVPGGGGSTDAGGTVAGGTVGGGGGLAVTGVEGVLTVGAVGVALVVAGAAGVVVTRRRRDGLA